MIVVSADFDAKNLFQFQGSKGFVWRETRPGMFQGFSNELLSAKHGTSTVNVHARDFQIELTTPKSPVEQAARDRYVLAVAFWLAGENGLVQDEDGQNIERPKPLGFWQKRQKAFFKTRFA